MFESKQEYADSHTQTTLIEPPNICARNRKMIKYDRTCSLLQAHLELVSLQSKGLPEMHSPQTSSTDFKEMHRCDLEC